MSGIARDERYKMLRQRVERNALQGGSAAPFHAALLLPRRARQLGELGWDRGVKEDGRETRWRKRKSTFPPVRVRSRVSSFG